MSFTDVLTRYHISPLMYEDGSLLRENDYVDLLRILTKYAYMKERKGVVISNDIKELLINKINYAEKNSLIPPSEEDIMDILLEQKSESVIEG